MSMLTLLASVIQSRYLSRHSSRLEMFLKEKLPQKRPSLVFQSLAESQKLKSKIQMGATSVQTEMNKWPLEALVRQFLLID